MTSRKMLGPILFSCALAATVAADNNKGDKAAVTNPKPSERTYPRCPAPTQKAGNGEVPIARGPTTCYVAANGNTDFELRLVKLIDPNGGRGYNDQASCDRSVDAEYVGKGSWASRGAPLLRASVTEGKVLCVTGHDISLLVTCYDAAHACFF